MTLAQVRWSSVPSLMVAAGMAAQPGAAGMSGVWAADAVAVHLVEILHHEAGHGAVARAFGVTLEAITIDPAPFSGGLCTFRRDDVDGLAAWQTRAIALAGTLAGALATRGAYRTTAGWLFAEITSGGKPLSEGDALLAGMFSEADVDYCLQLLIQRWGVVSLLARHALADLESRHAHVC